MKKGVIKNKSKSMIPNIEEINAASITFCYQNNVIHQSGLLINNYVITVGGSLFSLVSSEHVKSIGSFHVTVILQNNGKTISLPGFIDYICYSDKIKRSILKSNLGFSDLSAESYAKFFVIRMDFATDVKYLNINSISLRSKLYKGQDILTVSTPFGNNLFLNCFTQGIISNILSDELFLTDVRLSRGCEGGPVYEHNESYTLIGMVLLLFKADEEYTGFNLCCNFFSIYTACWENRTDLPIKSLSDLQFRNENNIIDCISKVVLPVKTPITRGSCVLLSEKGLLVTCSHVINYDMNMPVEVKYEGKPYKAKVLSCSSKDDILDLAFLQIYPSSELPTCAFEETYPTKGKIVYVIGYEKLNENSLQLITKGTVLKHEKYGPVFTSCLTHNGYSGGGIFGKNGKLLAIICGIMFESASETLHHCHDVGIPVNFIKSPLQYYKLTGDISHLRTLCKMRNIPLENWALFTKSKL